MSGFSDQYLLQYLDRPSRILFWTIDETFVLFMPMLIALAIDCFLTGIVASIVGLFVLRKIKRISSNGALKHINYWYLLTPKYKRTVFPYKKAKNILPPSYVREYLG